MSIPVSLADLPATLGRFGPGFLLSVSTRDGAGPKAVSVSPREQADGSGALLVPGPGGGTLANVAAHPPVTLVFAPADPADLSLIVDGIARVEGDDVRIEPTGAVLHRSAVAGDHPG